MKAILLGMMATGLIGYGVSQLRPKPPEPVAVVAPAAAPATPAPGSWMWDEGQRSSNLDMKPQGNAKRVMNRSGGTVYVPVPVAVPARAATPRAVVRSIRQVGN
jgi:hypothetical protein